MGWLKNLIAKRAGKKIAREIGLQEDSMEEKKSWWKSKTIWSGVLAVAVSVYNSAREPLGASFGITLPEIPEFVFAVLGGMGIYGRVSAKVPVGK